MQFTNYCKSEKQLFLKKALLFTIIVLMKSSFFYSDLTITVQIGCIQQSYLKLMKSMLVLTDHTLDEEMPSFNMAEFKSYVSFAVCDKLKQ